MSLFLGATGCNVTPIKNTSKQSSIIINENLTRFELFFHVENGASVSEVVKTMVNRLDKTETVNYQVIVQDQETIKVSFYGYDFEKMLVSRYLTYDGTLAISNSKGTYVFGNEFLNAKEKAFTIYADDKFEIIIPIDKNNEPFKAVYQEAKEMSDNGTGEVEVEREGGEREHKAYLYLWYNFIEDIYTYDKINMNNADSYDPKIAEDVLMLFDAADPFLDEEHDALKTYISLNDDDLEQTNKRAQYYVNIINAGPLNYKVSEIFF